MKKYIIETEDIGKIEKTESTKCHCCGLLTNLHIDFKIMGRVQTHDVGKIMILNNEIWQVENDEQMTTRLKNNN